MVHFNCEGGVPDQTKNKDGAMNKCCESIYKKTLLEIILLVKSKNIESVHELLNVLNYAVLMLDEKENK